MKTYGSSQARAQWRDMLDLAAARTDVVIERHGKPIAVVIAYDDYAALQNVVKETVVETLMIIGDAVDREYD